MMAKQDNDFILGSEDLTLPQRVHRHYRTHTPWYWGVAGFLGFLVLFSACNSMTRNQQPVQRYAPAPQVVPQSTYDDYDPTYIPVPVPVPGQTRIIRERVVVAKPSPKVNRSDLGKAKVVGVPSVRRKEYTPSTTKTSTWGGNRARETTFPTRPTAPSNLGNASGVNRTYTSPSTTRTSSFSTSSRSTSTRK